MSRNHNLPILVLHLMLLLAATLVPTAFGLRIAQAASLSGFVYDATDKEALPYATVQVKGTSLGAVTNQQGYFLVNGLTPGAFDVVFGYVGYTPEVRSLRFDEGDAASLSVTVELNPQAVEMETIEVVADASELTVETGKLTIKTRELSRIPAVAEVDLFRAVQSLPGVSAISDFSSGLFVRGGSPDQNLILLDDIDVYNPNHLFGFFSTFNVDAVKTVELQKSGYPARYGGRLSSLLDVHNRDGNRLRTEGVARVGIIGSSITLEGPWPKGSWMVSGRHTYIEPLAKAMEIDLPYKFYDLHGKLNYDLGTNERTSVSYYGGKDQLDWDRTGLDVLLDWGNNAWSAQWTHIFNPRLFSYFVLGHSSFDSRAIVAFRDFTFKNHNQIDDLSLKASLTHSPSADHMIDFGGEFKALAFRFDRWAGEEDRLTFKYDGTYAAIYAQDAWRALPGLQIQTGLRVDYYSKGDWFKVGPRLSVRRELGPLSAATLTYGRYAQFLNLVAQEGASFADMWFPVDRSVAPGIADHLILGYELGPYEGFDLTAELYWKPYRNLVEFSEEFTRSLVTQDAQLDDLFNSGTGDAYGADLYVKNTWRGWEGWLGYSWGVAERKVRGYNFDREFHPDHDRRHQIVLMQDRGLGKGWRLNVAFRYGTGQPVTLAAGRYRVRDITGREYDLVLDGGRNAYRLPDYHRLDLGISWLKKFKRWSLEPNIQIINVYDQENIYIRSYDTTKNPAEFDDVTMIPFLPTIGFTVRF